MYTKKELEGIPIADQLLLIMELFRWPNWGDYCDSCDAYGGCSSCIDEFLEKQLKEILPDYNRDSTAELREKISRMREIMEDSPKSLHILVEESVRDFPSSVKRCM